MREPSQAPKVILIGGTSHVGKSTVAAALADARTASLISTDGLSRHPGRPWRSDDALPADVIAYYSQNATESGRRDFFLDDIWRHCATRVGPIVAAITACRLDNPYDRPTIIEGSAILPNRHDRATVRVYYLTLPDALVIERVRQNSGYAERDDAERLLIDTFLERALDFQSRLIERADPGELIDAAAYDSNDAIVEYLTADLQQGG